MYIKKGRPTVPRVSVSCAVCAASLVRRESDLARLKTGRVFCSLVCRDKVARKPRRGKDVPCAVCGTPFYKRLQSIQRYCSRRCHDQSQIKPRVSRTCEVCEKVFELKQSTAATQAGKYCSRRCMGIGTTKRSAGFDFNGRPAIVDHFGYVRVWQPDHPKAAHGRVLEHRLVMERAIGRRLTADEQVDHVNRIKTDNRRENLQLLSASAHSIKTNGDRIRDVEEAKSVMSELEQYRARYGPINS